MIIENTERVGVLLPLLPGRPFDYRVPFGMVVAPGDWVRVPFGRKSLWGVVWGKAEGALDVQKIKQVEAVAAHIPPMSDAMRAYLAWVAWYTAASKGMVLKMAMPIPEVFDAPTEDARYVLSGERQIKLTPARLRIASYLSDNVPRTAREITLRAKVSPAVLKEFMRLGGLVETVAPAKAWVSIGMASMAGHSDHRPYEIGNSPSLSSMQQAAADALRAKIAAGFSVTLIDGVTGSGKTEVYFDTIAACLEKGLQALVLLPEIALSVQWLTRFEKRFGFAPVVWHSGITPAKRRDAWRQIALGEARVVVGARSALFLPFRRLGFIAIDEEHDASYKQEEGVIYQARDMAVVRGKHEKIPVVLVSATPSLETEFNIEQGRYQRLHLPSRHGEAELPGIRLIDMRTQKLNAQSWISEPLKAALSQTLSRREQSLLFMNRRGYAPLMLCRACGHRFQCPHCTGWLVLHRSGGGRLVCHHCGHQARVPKACPDCAKEDSLLPYGPGVERIAEEARALFPDARIAVMTSDACWISNKTGEAQDSTPAELIARMSEGGIDILVGTQMIAKGHHFAGLALVGVMDADMGLAGGDLRAGERTYQLLHQLAGRAGREKTRGEVWLQTYQPEHPVMKALVAGDRDRYMRLEAQMREDAGMPPYGKLAAVIIEGANEQEVAGYARQLVRNAAAHTMLGAGGHGQTAAMPVRTITEPLVLGPAPAPLLLLRGKFRYRILIKAGRACALQSWIEERMRPPKTPASIRVKIDIDPYSFM